LITVRAVGAAAVRVPLLVSVRVLAGFVIAYGSIAVIARRLDAAGAGRFCAGAARQAKLLPDAEAAPCNR
jgi:hypothetical protein